MIAWLIGIITLILLLLIAWRRRSKNIKDRFENPKFQFLRNLGITSTTEQHSRADVSEENNHAKPNS